MGSLTKLTRLTAAQLSSPSSNTTTTTTTTAMDAIRKKMKSLKDETDQLYSIINKFEEATKESNRVADQADCDIRDYGKKVHGFEIEFDETTDKLNKALAAYEEKDKNHREVEADIAALSRRIMLMEEEAKKAETTLANTVTKLAISSKEADDILGRCGC